MVRWNCNQNLINSFETSFSDCWSSVMSPLRSCLRTGWYKFVIVCWCSVRWGLFSINLIELSTQTIVMSQYLRIYNGINTTCHFSIPPFGPIIAVAVNFMSARLMIVCIFNGPHLTWQLVYCCIYMVQAIGVSRVLRIYTEVSGYYLDPCLWYSLGPTMYVYLSTSFEHGPLSGKYSWVWTPFSELYINTFAAPLIWVMVILPYQ